MKKIHKLPLAPNYRYLLFSRAGFTEEMENAAANDADLFLISSLFEEPALIP